MTTNSILFPGVYSVTTTKGVIDDPIAITPEFTKEYVIWSNTSDNVCMKKYSKVFFDGMEVVNFPESSPPAKIEVFVGNQNKYILVLTNKFFDEKLKQVREPAI